MNIDNAKSYKTEANLVKGLEKLGFTGHDHRHLVVCNREGRFTAVFFASNFRNGGYVCLYSQHGFFTV